MHTLKVFMKITLLTLLMFLCLPVIKNNSSWPRFDFNVFSEQRPVALSKISSPATKNRTILPAQKNERAQLPGSVYFWEDEGWMVPILTPYLSIYNKDPRDMAFMGLSKEAFYIHRHYLPVKTEAPIYTFIESRILKKRVGIMPAPAHTLPSGISTFSLSTHLARTFLKKSSTVIFVLPDNMEFFLKASIYASQLKIPIIAIDDTTDHEAIEKFLKEMKVVEILGAKKVGPIVDTELLKISWTPLTVDKMEQLTLEKMKKTPISNVIVSALPRVRYTPFSDPVFFAPYISLLRNAPLFLTKSSDGLETEKCVYAYLNTHQLRPRNITLLADHNKITSIPAAKVITEAIYNSDEEIFVEPLSSPQNGKAIPFDGLTSVTLMYAKLNHKKK